MYMSRCSHSGKENRSIRRRLSEKYSETSGKDYYECVSPANIDLICANIFESGEDYEIIDYEWTFDFPIRLLYHVENDP